MFLLITSVTSHSSLPVTVIPHIATRKPHSRGTVGWGGGKVLVGGAKLCIILKANLRCKNT